MKSNWKLLFLSLSVSALLVGCEPPVDRNAETLESTETTSASAESVTSTDPAPVIVADPNQATDPASVLAAASEIIPESLREYTEFPEDKSSASLKKYLDSLRSPEFQAVLISMLQSQDESAQIGITAARKVILENEKLAADLILGAEDATLEEYQAALQIQLDEKMGSSASVDALELEMNVIRDRVAKGRFPELAKQVDCTLNTRKLFDKGATLLQGEAPKPEQVDEFYAEYMTQLEAVIAADALNDVQLQALLGLSQIFEEQPEKAVAIFEKINTALESKTDERMTQLRGMLAQQIETLKADIEIQKITPEQVKEQYAPFKVLPEEKTPSAYVTYMKTLESPEFQEVSRKMNSIRKEDVKAVVKEELDAILKNMGVVADEILKSEAATEAECREALEMKFQLALMTEEGEEALKPAQIKERFTTVQNEVKVERFPKIADAAACYVNAVTILEKVDPLLQPYYGSTANQLPEEQAKELKNTVYPEVEALVKQVCDADALGGLPFQVIQSLALVYSDDKEKVKPLLETMISALETKTDEDSKQLLSELKMQLAMIENPQAMMQGQNPHGAGMPEQAQKELSAEEIDALKQKLESYIKVPENATATELDAYVKSIDGPEFQSVIMPLMQTQDAEQQKWVTEIIGKLQTSLIDATTAICKAEDATEEQYRNALEIRLDIMRADKVRKNIEPKYAELIEEVKSGRFPAMVTKVELDMAAEEVMDKANAMFSNAETPSAEQLEELFKEFMPFVEKVASADALKGPQLQMIMQIASVFSEDNAKMKPICETLLKGLEGKTDPQSTQLASMFKTRLEEIQFMSEPMTFTAPEGTELEELKKMVTQKMEIIMRSSTREGLPEEKLSEFLAAVEKFGNADLTAYTSWQIDLIHMIPLLMTDNLDVEAFKTKYLECVKTGTEKKLFNANCLQMCIQMVAIVEQRTSADQTNSESVKATVREMATSLLPVCEQVQGPEMEMMRQSLDSLLKGLDKADENADEKAETPAETPAEEAPNTDALPETIQLDDESTEALDAPAENNVSFREEVISPSISVATTIDLDELEEDELPEDDVDEEAEEVEEEDADAEEPELPAEILEVITLPEDATPEELVEFYGRRELVEEICLSNGELAQTILETFVANMEVVAKKVLKMKDVSEKAFSIALFIEIDSIASKNQEKEEDAFNAAFNELEEMVKKSAFPQFLPRVEARKALFNFLLKLRKENGQVSDELIEELNVIFPQLAKTAGSPEEVECVLGILIVCQKEQTLELARLVATELEKKEGEEWEPLQEQFQEMIASLEEAMKPIQMEMEEGATLEDMKEKVDAQFTKILASGKLDDEKKWEELENAVAALKEDKLNEYFLWQKDVFSLLKEVTNGMSSSVMSGEEFDGSKVLPKLNELADRAGEIQLTEQSFMLFVQVSAMLMQFGDNSEEELLALVAKLEKIGESVDSENVEAVIEQLKSLASGEDTADDSEDEEIEEDSEEVTPLTTEFVPEEGADADELQKAVVAQITGLLNQDMENPSDALNEFLESVKAQENDELTAFATWNVNFFQFFFETLRDPEAGKDVNALGEKFTALIVEGTELEAFEMETLLLASRFSMQLISALDEKGTLALADALTNALEGQDYEWVPLVQEDLEGKLAQAKLVGNPLELEAETLDGESVKIQDFAGKTVLVDVWATWCGPCIGEIPNMKQAYDAYHEAGFEIIGLSIDDDLTALEDFQKEEKLPWIIATQEKMDPEMVKFSDKYGISGIPTMFLVGADGNVITTNARGRLMELLAEIYPDVEVKEEAPVELPDEIELEEDEDVEEIEIELEEDLDEEEDADTVSESMSTTEEAPVTGKVDATFVAPEGADMQTLRKEVFMQARIVVDNHKENLDDALTKYQKSVEALGNAELNEFTAWNMSLIRFFHLPPLSEVMKEKSSNEISEELVALMVSGMEKKSLEPESLMLLVRVSMNMASALDTEHAKNLLSTLLQTLENREEPWVMQVKMMVGSRVKQLGMVGNPVILEAETLDGKSVKIQDFVGKTVLIDVWATWCGPCVGEIPNMKKAYDAFHEAGFEIIGLSVDRDVTALEKFQEKEALPWVIATEERMGEDKEKFADMYGVIGIPAMFLIGADGNVITTNARGRLMEILSEIYPEAAEKARKAEEEAMTLEAPEALPSQAMSTTEEAGAEIVTDAAPTVLDTYSVLPKDESVESLREFLTGAEQAAYEIQSVLREMSEAEAMKAFLKVQETCGLAADRLIANSETPADVLKMAVGVKMRAISFTERFTMNVAASDSAYAELVKALEARNAPEMVMEVQVTQLVGLSQRGDRMPTVEDMTALLEKIVEICDRAKLAKCMNGDVMGRFMQMIVFANDCGVTSELIDRACQSLRESVVATEDPQLLNTADFITGMARRAALKGKPMELVGVTLDGKEVDIQKDYAGKVVLVDFWATWCNPCVMELRNLEHEYYAKYHEKGFEILGFSIDVDKNQLATFLERRKLPWQTILQKDNAVGCEEPVYYYGIQAIPCLILVGPDGKVICEIPTMRRDEVLSAELKKIYGE